MSTEQFETWAARHGVTLTAVNIPARPDRSGDDWDKDAIHFMVTIYVNRRVMWAGCYSVGSAHPEMWAKQLGAKAPHQIKKALHDLKGLSPRSIMAEEIRSTLRNAYAKQAPIELGDVLLSLQMDISGADQPFDDWASDLGMDTDSRRALHAYEQCVAIREAFRATLPPEAFAEFLELEEE